MKRNYDLKRRESGDLPPEKSQEILSRIYPEGTVNELMDKLFETDKQDHPTEKGGEWWWLNGLQHKEGVMIVRIAEP